MAVIPWPAGIQLRDLEWSQPPVEQVNRSAWSGATRGVGIGPAWRWSAQGEFPKMRVADKVAWSGFVFALKGRRNSFRLVAVEEPQHVDVVAVAANGSQGPSELLLLKGLPASVTLLRAGHLLTVKLASGDEQLVGLATDLVSDTGGNAVASLANVLREPVANNAPVETRLPWALMRSPAGARWAVEPGAKYNHQFEAEEAF